MKKSLFSDLLGASLSLLGNIGFTIEEEMIGTHQFEPDYGPPGRRPFYFKVKWGTGDLKRWLWGEDSLVNCLWGRVTVGGLCENVLCGGTLSLRYFKDNTLCYDFGFEVDGTAYHFVGEKVNIKPWNLPVSHTTCFGRITEEETGRLVSTAIVFFRLRTIPRFLLSFRPFFGLNQL